MSVKKLFLSAGLFSAVFIFAVPTLVFAGGYAESAYYGQATYYAQSTYYAQGTYYTQAGYYTQASYNLTINKPVVTLASTSVVGDLSKGGGSFVIDDPLDPFNKLLYHSFVESPDVKNLYDGTAVIDSNGEAVVQLPDYFEALNKDYRYQLKPIDKPMPNLYVKVEEANNQFTIGGGVPGGTVSWQITGIRHDQFIVDNPIQVLVKKGAGAQVGVGQFIYPEGYATQSHWALIVFLVLVVIALARHIGLLRILLDRRRRKSDSL